MALRRPSSLRTFVACSDDPQILCTSAVHNSVQFISGILSIARVVGPSHSAGLLEAGYSLLNSCRHLSRSYVKTANLSCWIFVALLLPASVSLHTWGTHLFDAMSSHDNSQSPPPSPGHPNPDSDDPEERMHAAILAVRRSGLRPNKTHNLSLREAAELFNVRRSTLTSRFSGVKPRKEAHAHERVLSPEKSTLR